MGQLSVVYVNDYPLERLGFQVERPIGGRDVPQHDFASVPVMGRSGTLVLDPRPRTQGRTVELVGILVQDTAAQLRDALDALRERLGNGQVELRTAERTDVFCLARLQSFQATPLDNRTEYTTTAVHISAKLWAEDSWWFDHSPLIVGAPAATRVACPTGSVPVAPITQILGSATNPILTLRNAAGDALGTLGITLTLAATDFLEIDHWAQTITKVVSGVASDGIALLSSGSFLTLDPTDGDRLAGSFPTLEVSAGQLMVQYRRVWR